MRKIILLAVCALLCACAWGQPKSSTGIFDTVGKYMAAGDAESLSAWFDDNLEVSVLSESCIASKGQARQIVSAFFETWNPRSFKISHTSGTATMKYALGELSAGGRQFLVVLFVCFKQNSFVIQQIKITGR